MSWYPPYAPASTGPHDHRGRGLRSLRRLGARTLGAQASPNVRTYRRETCHRGAEGCRAPGGQGCYGGAVVETSFWGTPALWRGERVSGNRYAAEAPAGPAGPARAACSSRCITPNRARCARRARRHRSPVTRSSSMGSATRFCVPPSRRSERPPAGLLVPRLFADRWDGRVVPSKLPSVGERDGSQGALIDCIDHPMVVFEPLVRVDQRVGSEPAKARGRVSEFGCELESSFVLLCQPPRRKFVELRCRVGQAPGRYELGRSELPLVTSNPRSDRTRPDHTDLECWCLSSLRKIEPHEIGAPARVDPLVRSESSRFCREGLTGTAHQRRIAHRRRRGPDPRAGRAGTPELPPVTHEDCARLR
jgi:hypothetical protein